MKFMKLGSKPDSFQTEGNNIRYVASEVATDIVINVGDVKFCLHKFPLLSKSSFLQKVVTDTHEGSNEVNIHEIPGGPAAFEICAKFCYGMTVTLNAYNVIAARCAAEYLGMHETTEKGNLVYKIDVFLNTSIFRSWKDSITVLKMTKALLPVSEELKLTRHCLDAIASKASVDVSKVNWSYTYNREKFLEDNGNDPSNWNAVKNRVVPKDWWVEDLCELEIDLFKQVIGNLKNKGIVSNDVIGEALKAYTLQRLPGFDKGGIKTSDFPKTRAILETIVRLLPLERGSVPCSFSLKLLKASIAVELGERTKKELVKRAGQQLQEALVEDLLIPVAQKGKTTVYDVHVIHKVVEEFMMQDKNAENGKDEIKEITRPGILSEAAKLIVAKLVDGYLSEIAKDPNLPLATFIDLSGLVSCVSRPRHDGLYRAIDMYLKVHPSISKSERKKLCKLMDCKKLSVDACMHAVQNERLPLRVVVQILFFEQVRAAASSGSSTPDLPKAIRDLNNNSTSHGSSRSATTNTEDDWDAVASAEELRALKEELAAWKTGNNGDSKNPNGKVSVNKMRGLLMSKRILLKNWSGKHGNNENSGNGSDSSESLGSSANNLEEPKSTTPSRKVRHSVF